MPFPLPSSPRWLLGPSIVVMGASVALLHVFTAEDAYITARYAENLVTHGELHFNPGERVNALTSPLHALLEAALFALTGTTVPAYKVVGLACLLGTCGLVVALLRGRPRAQAAALAVLAAPCVMLWTFGGLETPLLMLEATALVALSYRSAAPTPRVLYLVAALCGLAVLTRYDAVLFAGPVALAMCLRGRGLRALVGPVLLGAGLVGAWLVFAHAYYGDVLPTSYYVKTPSTDRWAVNGWYVLQYLVYTGVVPLVAAALAVRRRGGRGGLLTGRLAGVGLGLAVVCAYAFTAATTHMMFGFRLMVPYLPALALLAADLLDRRWPEGQGAARWQAPAFALLITGLTAFQGYQLAVTYTGSVNGLARGFEEQVVGTDPVREGKGVEYRREGARAYMAGFMDVLARQAADIRAHWARQGHARPPRVYTYAAGMLPYRLREAYVFEVLVSHRRGCDYPYSRALSADYLHLMSPRHGAVEQQLPLGSDRYRLVSSYTVPFDGRAERFLVYYNPEPFPNPLPPALHDPCPPAAALARAALYGR